MKKMTRGKDRRDKTRGKDLREDRLMRKHKLYLRMFDGEGSAAAASGTQASGATVPAAAAQQAENRPASGETTPDLDARFDEMVNGEFKEVFSRRMEAATKERLRKQGAKYEQTQNALQEQLNKSNELLGLIGSKYGITDGNTDRIREEIERDTTYWEDAAAKEGMSVDQYMEMVKIKRENAEFKRMHEELQRTQARDRVLAKWNDEAKELETVYKGFSLEKELQNPTFCNLLKNGVNMRQAYEAIHMDEILSGAMAHTAKTVAKRQIDAIKNGQSHPVEGAASSGRAVKTSRDFSKMSLEESREYARRARNGEIITFQEG